MMTETSHEYVLGDLNLSVWHMEKIGRLRFYWREGTGRFPTKFDFKLLEWVSCPGDSQPWSDDSTVELIAHGSAVFDGVRHMWVGEGGYLHYPDHNAMAQFFTRLAELQADMCDGVGL